MSTFLTNSVDETEEAKLVRQAREFALARLSAREYSGKELINYLKRKGFSPELSEQTASRLAQEGILDDRRYARALTRSQVVRDKGPAFIHAKLRQKGVRIELNEVRDLFAETSNHSELELAQRMIEKRYPRAHEDERELRRAYAALLRRGFSSEIARKVLRGKITASD